MGMATIGDCIADATARLREAGSETARLDAELLLGWAIGADRTTVVAHRDGPVGADALAKFEDAVRRRAAGEPLPAGTDQRRDRTMRGVAKPTVA